MQQGAPDPFFPEQRRKVVYCGAFTKVSLVSDGDQGECTALFSVQMDDPECPTRWWPCPVCGTECEVEW
jgi:hypothetical protein